MEKSSPLRRESILLDDTWKDLDRLAMRPLRDVKDL